MPNNQVIPQVEQSILETGKPLKPGPNTMSQALSYLVTTSDLIPPWYSRQRDIELHRVVKASSHLSGLFYLATTKLANIPFAFVAKDPTVVSHVIQGQKFTKQIMQVSEFGEGLRQAMKKFIYDYMIYDNGAFLEIIGNGDPVGPIEGMPTSVRHLDSNRVVRTGNPLYPIRYEEDGKWYRFFFSRVIMLSQQPSGMQNMNGVGFSAASRAYEVAQVLGDQIQYKLEKMGSRPTSQIIAAKNIEAQEVVKAFMVAEELMNQLGLQRFAKNVILAGNELEVDKIDLNNFEPFDEEVGTLMAMYSLAYIIGLDIRDVWPITGAKASDQIANMKARGRLPADFTGDLKEQIDWKLSPPYLEIRHDFQDDDEDMARANIQDIRSRRVQRLSESGAVDQEGQRWLLREAGDITREEFTRLQHTDGKLENGMPVAILYESSDPLIMALLSLEGIDDPLIFEDNDPDEVTREIHVALTRVYELLATTSSLSQRQKALEALAALDWLKAEYASQQMSNLAAMANPEEGEEDGQHDTVPTSEPGEPTGEDGDGSGDEGDDDNSPGDQDGGE
jgi:hypothetical protein